MNPKIETLLRFSRVQLKHPTSKYLLEALAEEPDLVQRLTFVLDREFLPNTMLISEAGSSRVAFELELGAHQREEVSIVNGRLVRHTRRTRSVCINEPMEALPRLREFKGRLYVMFAFAKDWPAWYQAVVEPNPALPPRAEAKQSIDNMIDEIVREQIDLALLAILLRDEIDQALATGNEAAFRERVAVYRELVQRCLWEL